MKIEYNTLGEGIIWRGKLNEMKGSVTIYRQLYFPIRLIDLITIPGWNR
jgi:hypothetical protein